MRKIIFIISLLASACAVRTDKIKMRILVDVGSIEVFLNDGELVMTSLFFPQEPFCQVQLINKSSNPLTVFGVVHAMRSIWSK